MPDDLVIRPARAGDAASLSRLGELDAATSFGLGLAALARSSRRGAVLVAEANGALVAALDLRKGHIVADPFKPSAAARQLLELRYRQFENAGADSSAPLRRRIARHLPRAGRVVRVVRRGGKPHRIGPPRAT